MGGSNGLTRSDLFRHTMREDEIPSITPPENGSGVISYFFDMRQFQPDAETRLTMTAIEDWQRYSGIDLDKWELKAVVLMDRALGKATAEMVKFHETTVSKLKLQDKDRGKNGRR